MSAATSNVIISFTKEPIKRLFEAGGSTKNLLKTLTDSGNDNLILFNKENNPMLDLTEIDGVKVNESVPINIFTGVDPASSVKRTADYSF